MGVIRWGSPNSPNPNPHRTLLFDLANGEANIMPLCVRTSRGPNGSQHRLIKTRQESTVPNLRQLLEGILNPILWHCYISVNGKVHIFHLLSHFVNFCFLFLRSVSVSYHTLFLVSRNF